MVPRDKEDWNRILSGGVAAGVFGGIVVALFGLAANVLEGRDFWLAFKGAGVPFLGERAMQPGFDLEAVIVGALSHMAVSIAWAVPFAMLVYGLTRGTTLVSGVLWGFIVWVGMYYVLLPMLGLQQIPASVPVGMAIVEHVVFGVAVAVGFLPYQRLKMVLPAH
ncbi:DUF1440 domain-containing protein [Pendulispora rubella]|uniref:DUF1440 domain-containing protein n=1 Tax=Pendulispora rubella TaxID=2741070 RepID=A0ABZ2KZK1_9BACT